MTRRTLLVPAAAAAPVVVFALTYVPAAGHGFIADDFSWILHNRIRTAADLWRIAMNDSGFYRPAVAFSFAVNELMFGVDSRGYGLTNVALALVCGAAVYALCRAAGAARGASAFGAAVWLLNLHGVNMAVLWISGRTTLLATAAAAGSAAALLRGRHALAILLYALALLSREDTLLLPAVMAVWAGVLGRAGAGGSVRLRRWLLGTAAVVAVYFVFRSSTDAMTPLSAPPFYRFTVDPAVVLRNAAEYADRTASFAAAVLVLAAVLLRPARRRVDAPGRAAIACGLVWLIGLLGPALLLPVRSSLYACLPSAGVCVAVAAILQRWWESAPDVRRAHALYAAIVLPFALWPVLHARTERWVAIAEFSSRTLADLRTAAAPYPDDTDILIVDERRARANIASAFSTLLRDAFLLTTGRYMTFYVDPPIPDADARGGGLAGCAGCIDIRLAVRAGRLVRD